MIKKKKKINEEIVCSYDSSNILASKYEPKSKKLTITFNRGTQYLYLGVEPNEYKVFEEAKSQGVEFNKIIKIKDFEKLGDVDPIKLVEEIEKGVVEKTDLDKDEKQLVVAMESFLIFHKTKNTLDIAELTDLKYFLDKVLDQKNKK